LLGARSTARSNPRTDSVLFGSLTVCGGAWFVGPLRILFSKGRTCTVSALGAEAVGAKFPALGYIQIAGLFVVVKHVFRGIFQDILLDLIRGIVLIVIERVFHYVVLGVHYRWRASPIGFGENIGTVCFVFVRRLVESAV